MTNQKHICLITPSFNIGGIERTIAEFANHFAGLGYQVSLISCLKGESFYALNPSIQIYQPASKRKKGAFSKLITYYKLVLFLRKIIGKLKPDTVLSMADIYNPVVILASFGLKVPVFVGDVTKPDRKFNSLVRTGKKFLYPYSAGFIAQTKFAEKYYKEKFKNKLNIRVINGAVKEMKHAIELKKKIILSVGRLSYEKGHDRLIEAFALTKCKDEWQLVITSDGPMKQQLNALAKSKNIVDQTLFLGGVKNIDRFYAEAEIFVLPSRMEGFPNVLCEAMAAGLACVSFDSFPVDEIITNNLDGLIVKDGDINELAAKIDLLAENSEQRNYLGNNAKRIRNRLSMDTIGSEMLNFILEE